MEATAPFHNQIAALAPWFHNLHLPDGTQTAPDHFLGDFPAFKWQELSSAIPQDLSGWRVLDIGCNAGFYTFELARRGADVLGIDIDPHYLKQAQWAAGQYKLEKKVQFRQMQVYDLAQLDEKFDLVGFMGVFYHLRYPMLAMDIIAQRAANLLVFQTLSMQGTDVLENTYDRSINDRSDLDEKGWPKMAFIEHRFSGDPTNWWIANHTCIEAMMRSCGFEIVARPAHEIYVGKKIVAGCAETWNSSEYHSALQRSWQEAAAVKVHKPGRSSDQ